MTRSSQEAARHAPLTLLQNFPMPIVLVVEDEIDIAELIEFNLKKNELDVLLAYDGLAGVEMARETLPDLIVLDVMMPKLDGFGVLKQLKEQEETKSIPVVMLTAMGQPDDRIKGLESGADDYISKPFSPRELVLRVKAVMKRTLLASSSEDLSVGPFRFDRNTLQFFAGEEVLDLTMTEFKLMLYLCERAGEVQDRFVLLKDVWGYHDDVHSRTLDTHMKRLRNKLGEYSELLETVRGVGYQIVKS